MIQFAEPEPSALVDAINEAIPRAAKVVPEEFYRQVVRIVVVMMTIMRFEYMDESLLPY